MLCGILRGALGAKEGSGHFCVTGVTSKDIMYICSRHKYFLSLSLCRRTWSVPSWDSNEGLVSDRGTNYEEGVGFCEATRGPRQGPQARGSGGRAEIQRE